MPTRKELIRELEQIRNSRVICYFTGDRQNQEIQIGDDIIPSFSQHLSKIGKVAKLDLLIYSRGGNTLTGFTLANAFREFGQKVYVLVPFRAQSCATLIALGADSIVMGPFGQLSPIDPSITTPHGPSIQDGGIAKFVPVSVEDVANYFELARKEAGIKEEQNMATVLGHLCNRVNPLALGAVYRSRQQIGMLATKLLKLHGNNADRIDGIVSQLTRELLSHDYVINRKEAQSIGLSVTDASDAEANLMWQIYEGAADELKLAEPWVWENEIKGQQSVIRTNTRGIIESRDLKHVFSSTYDLKRATVAGPGGGGKVDKINITVIEERWKVV